ncbi:uncharacterized protein CCR75_006184 [Bremia lactucae]|uniref:Uncharacterized protein n=1 Tax=Bremia lactucae TaxID=4779 RepID=A0A976IAZ3_BRELC|nr:hypothetical protein CCR75_004124 [Bremia lactucae]TDH70963.1 hypothetical protein CCR75_006184 [Bremia lactucae]
MVDSDHFPTSLDCFESDNLSGLHANWLDDENLCSLPLADVFTNAKTSRAQDNTAGSLITTGVTNQPQELNEELIECDAPLLDTVLNFSIDLELSPILEPFDDATVTTSPRQLECRYQKSPKVVKKIDSPTRNALLATASLQASSEEVRTSNEEHTLSLVVSKRPRTRSSSWLQQEKSTFFSMFKVKWPKGEHGSSLGFLLRQRFDAISTKVRTKSVMEVQQFYADVIHYISELLKILINDIDLMNADQISIS